jgi:hypothetical protein
MWIRDQSFHRRENATLNFRKRPQTSLAGVDFKASLREGSGSESNSSVDEKIVAGFFWRTAYAFRPI